MGQIDCCCENDDVESVYTLLVAADFDRADEKELEDRVEVCCNNGLDSVGHTCLHKISIVVTQVLFIFRSSHY